MKNHYKNNFKAFLRQKANALFVALTLCGGAVFGQNSYTFTNAGQTGSVGPTQTQVNASYSLTNLNGLVTTTTNGIQTWTVPFTGNYRIEARGAQGGGAGGLGARMEGDFNLLAGEVIRILVGQQGENGGTGPHGGGGGSFVMRAPYNTTTAILVIAGGGSGAGNYGINPGLVTTSGGSGGSAGGTNGTGGLGGSRGAGGGGFLTAGSPCTVNANYASPGQSYINGGLGGPRTNHTCNFTASGGFGGGSSHGGNCINNGGAGGGFSGGGGSSNTPSGGGGSFNNGTNQLNVGNTNSGMGRVVITELCSISLTSSGTNSTAPLICSGTSLTLTSNVASNYTWSTGNSSTTSIVVSPTVTTTYSVIGTSTANCVASANINVVVFSGVPSLSISNPSNNICLGATVVLDATGAVTYTWTGGVVNNQTFTPVSTSNYTVTGENVCGTSTAVTSITVTPLAVSALATPTVVCEGLPSVLTASSAVSGYTWLPGGAPGSSLVVVPLVNTIYTVSASDGTCSGTQTVEVTTLTTPTITVSGSSSVICAGAQLVLTAGGADTYTWSPGNLTGNSVTVSPTGPSLYIATGTNSVGCTSSGQQVVLVSPSPTVTAVANTTYVCSGNPIMLNAGGAATYTWTNGPMTAGYTVNPTGPTVYTVSGTHASNGCIASKTIAVSAFVPNITASSSTAVCLGGTVALTASGANIYLWSGIPSGSLFVANPQSTTIYTLVASTLTLNLNCPVTRTIEVLVNPTPTLTVVSGFSVVCRGESNTLTVSGASTYNWGTALGTGSSVVVSPTVTTVYTVTGTDANGCKHTVFHPAYISSCNSLTKQSNNNTQVRIYPNPSNSNFTISSETDLELRLINNLGQHIMYISLNESNRHQFQINELANGIYFVVGDGANQHINRKIVMAK